MDVPKKKSGHMKKNYVNVLLKLVANRYKLFLYLKKKINNSSYVKNVNEL